MPELPRFAEIPAERLDLEVAAMNRAFPSFQLGKRDFPYPHHYFRGSLQIFRKDMDVGIVAANLKAGHIRFDEHGSILPEDRSLEPLAYRKTGQLFKPIEVELVWRESPALPLLYALTPSIDDRLYPKLVHLNRLPPPRERERAHPLHAKHPAYPRCDICYIEAQAGHWIYDRNTAADAMNDGACWLAAFLLQTQGGIKEWVLGEAPHDLLTVMRETAPDDYCPCYSGHKFKSCHLPFFSQLIVTATSRNLPARRAFF
jgi:hypothetical protein